MVSWQQSAGQSLETSALAGVSQADAAQPYMEGETEQPGERVQGHRESVAAGQVPRFCLPCFRDRVTL